MKRFLYRIIGCISLVAMLVCGCGVDREGRRQNDCLQHMDTAMGTIVSQNLYGAEPETAQELLQLIKDLEEEYLSRREETAEIYRINESADGQTQIGLSTEMAEYLQACLEVSQLSEGAFDITLGEVIQLWDIDSWAGAEDMTAYQLPDEATIRQSLESTGYERLLLQDDTLQLPQGVQLDLGAVGKGIALDEMLEYLEEKEMLTGAVISVGGSVLTYGKKPDNSPWRVGVVNPLEHSRNLGYLELHGTWCISTSGDYERYVEIDGVRYHHILNPHTGYPADSGIRGVTVLSQNGLLSDALSTACFVLGIEEGRKLAECLEAEVLFVDKEGEITMTEGMKQYFHLSNG